MSSTRSHKAVNRSWIISQAVLTITSRGQKRHLSKTGSSLDLTKPGREPQQDLSRISRGI
eukprot:12791187-Alexandrium_andersonii.AAC.1